MNNDPVMQHSKEACTRPMLATKWTPVLKEDTGTEDWFILAIAPHEGGQVDDLPPYSTYYNYASEQENQRASNNVLELGTENDMCLN